MSSQRFLKQAFLAAVLIHAAIGAALVFFWVRVLPPRGEAIAFSEPALPGAAKPVAEPARDAVPAESVPAPPVAAERVAVTGAPKNGAQSSGAMSVSTSLSPSDPYFESIRAQISQHLSYPLSLKRRGVHGVVVLKLILDGGTLKSAAVEHSSTSYDLDRLALEAAKNASPFSGSPRGGAMEILLPIRFTAE